MPTFRVSVPCGVLLASINWRCGRQTQRKKGKPFQVKQGQGLYPKRRRIQPKVRDAQFSGIVSSDNANRDSLVLIVEQFAFAKETLQLGCGRICRVGSMADVDHHIHAEIPANGAFVRLLGICRTKQVANVRNGVFTL